MVPAPAPQAAQMPEATVVAEVSNKGASAWDVQFTWPVGRFEENGIHKLYTEAQLRAALAATPAAAASWAEPVGELLGHISDVLPDDAFDKINTAKWNAVSALVGIARATPAAGVPAAAPDVPTAQDSICAWKVWWTHDKARHTTTWQAALAAWNAAVAYVASRAAQADQKATP